VDSFLIHISARWLRALRASEHFFAPFLEPEAAEVSHRKE